MIQGIYTIFIAFNFKESHDLKHTAMAKRYLVTFNLA